MRMLLAFVAILGITFLGLHYYNTNIGRPAAQRVAFVPYLKNLVGLEPLPPAPDPAARAIAAAWLKSWVAPTAEAPTNPEAAADALARAAMAGDVEQAADLAAAEFARVNAALQGATEASAAPAAPQPRKPGSIGIGRGTCGDRAGAGKFCSVAD
jgi:hypothetical protein